MNNWDNMTNEELCIEYQQTNDNKLFEYFRERNMGMLRWFSSKISNCYPTFEIDEIYQVLDIALYQSMNKFDDSLNTKWTTLFDYVVKKAISDLLYASNTIKIPRNKVWHSSKFNKVVKSLDEPISSLEDDELTYADQLEDPDYIDPIETIIRKEKSDKLYKRLKMLEPKNQYCIIKYFGLSGNRRHTLQEIGDELNLTRERIRQLIVKGMKDLKLIYNRKKTIKMLKANDEVLNEIKQIVKDVTISKLGSAIRNRKSKLIQIKDICEKFNLTEAEFFNCLRVIVKDYYNCISGTMGHKLLLEYYMITVDRRMTINEIAAMNNLTSDNTRKLIHHSQYYANRINKIKIEKTNKK